MPLVELAGEQTRVIPGAWAQSALVWQTAPSPPQMFDWLQSLHWFGTFALPLQCTTRHSPLPWFPQTPPISFWQLGVPPRPPVGLHVCPLGQHTEVAGSGPQTKLPAGQADAVTAAALEAISIGAVQAVAAAALPPTIMRRREIWAWRPMCMLVPARCAERFAALSNQPAITGPPTGLNDAESELGFQP